MKKFIFIVTLLFLMRDMTMAQKYYQERIYEPIVVPALASALAPLYNAPVKDLYLYAYDATTKALHMIPFQIDEQTYGYDPFIPSKQRWFYFCPEWWQQEDSIQVKQHNGLFDDHDELVFMLQDMGDQAPRKMWIDNAESKLYQRLELEMSDPVETQKKAYVYIFRSSTITEQIPHSYNFSFDPTTQTVSCKNYSLRFNTNTDVIEDIKILPPLGNGVDFFDTQKIRVIGFLDFGFVNFSIGRGNTPCANERDFLYLYTPADGDRYWLKYTQNPVVRIVREGRQTIQVGGIPFHDMAFYVVTKFFPYCGSIDGGLALDDSTLKDAFPGSDDVHAEFDLIRQSWDFNENATGMKFYDKYNDGVLMDGNPDNVTKTVDLPIRQWTLASGPQGSLFTYITLPDVSWQRKEVYYYDNKNGGQGDETVVTGGDTGDKKSYGDQGLLLVKGASLELLFTAYFLPGNLTRTDGENLARWIQQPSVRASDVTSVNDKQEVAVPDQFKLEQNYPNPFNQSTIFDFELLKTDNIKFTIFDMTGKTLAVLAQGRFLKGRHQILWNGLNDAGESIASGVYLYRLETQNFQETKKLILVR